MRGLLVRVGIDQAYGAWNAPVDPVSRRFVYVPIPESAGTHCRAGLGRRYTEVVPALRRFGDVHACAPALPPALSRRLMHLDPDFATLTYGDNGSRRGAGVAQLERGDLLGFYAGLRPVRPCGHRLLYALVGFYVVDEVVRIAGIPRQRWGENAHTRKLTWGMTDIVVRARPGSSGRLERCIPIGEWRDRSYRVCRDLLHAWGGLSVHDGFIQRSAVPPAFVDAARFHAWFQSRRVRLVPDNN